MRGDKVKVADGQPVEPGSPPHARGQGDSAQRVAVALGITPACAGTSA